MNSSDIIRKKQNGTIYVATISTIHNGIDYQTLNSIQQGEYVCGSKVYSSLKLTDTPNICPFTDFYQGNKLITIDCGGGSYISTCSTLQSETVFIKLPTVCPSTDFYQGTCFY
jgi:hypothetical protein